MEDSNKPVVHLISKPEKMLKTVSLAPLSWDNPNPFYHSSSSLLFIIAATTSSKYCSGIFCTAEI